jgi:hypothetical protein
MLRKAVCVALFVAIPGFLAYPAALNVDPREKRPAPEVESGSLETWPLPTVYVVSVHPRWLVIQGPTTAHGQAQDSEALIKDVQRQLRRLGCYSGEINGVWTQSTGRAAQTFTDRVNATLPTERPDHILLALLQNHPDQICTKPCPLGENPAPAGRCGPAAIADLPVKTAAPSRPRSRIASWTAIETAALEDDIPELPPPKPSSRPPAKAESVKPQSAPRLATSKPAPQPSMAAAITTHREQTRHVHRPEREYPRVSQRAEREVSRTSHQPAFVRSVFQRAFDSSLR